MTAESAPVLPDVLRPGLKLVFCGTAASRRSAADQAYYAHPGNQFWKVLADVGLTPRRYAAAEFRSLLALGIGLTDLAKHASGNDDELPDSAFNVAALHARIEQCQPAILAFTSKNAAQVALGHPVDYGLQEDRFDGSDVFVLPSPSGQARRFWSIDPWRELAARLNA